MRSKHLLALENGNAKFVSSQYLGGISTKTKSSLNSIRAPKDSNGIYYFNKESLMDDLVSLSIASMEENSISASCIT